MLGVYLTYKELKQFRQPPLQQSSGTLYLTYKELKLLLYNSFSIFIVSLLYLTYKALIRYRNVYCFGIMALNANV